MWIYGPDFLEERTNTCHKIRFPTRIGVLCLEEIGENQREDNQRQERRLVFNATFLHTPHSMHRQPEVRGRKDHQSYP